MRGLVRDQAVVGGGYGGDAWFGTSAKADAQMLGFEAHDPRRLEVLLQPIGTQGAQQAAAALAAAMSTAGRSQVTGVMPGAVRVAFTAPPCGRAGVGGYARRPRRGWLTRRRAR